MKTYEEKYAVFSKRINAFCKQNKIALVYHSDTFGTGLKLGGAYSGKYALINYVRALDSYEFDKTKKSFTPATPVEEDDSIKGYTG